VGLRDSYPTLFHSYGVAADSSHGWEGLILAVSQAEFSGIEEVWLTINFFTMRDINA